MASRTWALGVRVCIVLALAGARLVEAQTGMTQTDEVVVGTGTYTAAGGWFATLGNQADRFAFRRWTRLPFASYDATNGETRPACGDFDGDGLDEIAIGMGTYPISGGWIAVFDDAVQQHRFLRWVRVPWVRYNAVNGETWPAAGDLDGDGLAELVVGLGRYPAQGGRLAVFDDARADFQFVRWLELDFTAYNAASGETRPAVGDLDGDGRAEIAVGTGTYPRSGGWVGLFEDAQASYRFTRWARLPWAAYNAANGETWPAVGDVDGDRKAELVLGQGTWRANGGWTCVMKDSAAGYVSSAWVRMAWAPYQAANGEVRPAVGDFDGDGRDELALGMGTYRVAGGWVQMREDARSAYASTRWVRLPWVLYDAANGATRPAAGNLKR